jgi:hypothetical protein
LPRLTYYDIIELPLERRNAMLNNESEMKQESFTITWQRPVEITIEAKTQEEAYKKFHEMFPGISHMNTLVRNNSL